MKLVVALAATTMISPPPGANAIEIRMTSNQISTLADEGALSGAIRIKLNSDQANKNENKNTASAQALSDDMGCGPATRVFPDAGVHEADHKAAGLHLWCA